MTNTDFFKEMNTGSKTREHIFEELLVLQAVAYAKANSNKSVPEIYNSLFNDAFDNCDIYTHIEVDLDLWLEELKTAFARDDYKTIAYLIKYGFGGLDFGLEMAYAGKRDNATDNKG